MNDMPIKPPAPVARPQASSPSVEAPTVSASLDKLPAAAASSDATTVSVASAQPRNPDSSAAGSALDKLLDNISSDKDALSAHAKIDAARVFDLLRDED